MEGKLRIELFSRHLGRPPFKEIKNFKGCFCSPGRRNVDAVKLRRRFFKASHDYLYKHAVSNVLLAECLINVIPHSCFHLPAPECEAP